MSKVVVLTHPTLDLMIKALGPPYEHGAAAPRVSVGGTAARQPPSDTSRAQRSEIPTSRCAQPSATAAR